MTKAPQYPPKNAIKPKALIGSSLLLKKEQNKQVQYEEFINAVTCLFVEGVEFMTKIQIYDAIKKEWKKCLNL